MQLFWILESCPGGSLEFEGREGVFIEGQVFPAFASVIVTIKTIPNDKIIRVLTDDQGQYRYVFPIVIREGYFSELLWLTVFLCQMFYGIME